MMFARCFRTKFFICAGRRWRSMHVVRPIVLGIETSCDDTAVAIVSSDKQVISRRVLVDRKQQAKYGGIHPHLSAMQHRGHVARLVDECLEEAYCRLGDLDAIAVTTKPGMVICLKTGVEHALGLARTARVPLIPVHHMRAHALSIRLQHDDIRFPFISLLISGGHCLLVLVKGPADFDIIGEDPRMSPGECLDKVARAVGITEGERHYGAEVERLAREADDDYSSRYSIRVPSCVGSNFNFESIKCSFLSLANQQSLPMERKELANFCASLQFHLAAHLCRRVASAFVFLDQEDVFPQSHPRYLVLSGGVASNRFIFGILQKVTDHFGYNLVAPPPKLCTDNGEMIAWTGIELLNTSSVDAIISHTQLPSSIFVHAKASIGSNELQTRWNTSKFKPTRKLKIASLLGTGGLRFTGKPANAT